MLSMLSNMAHVNMEWHDSSCRISMLTLSEALKSKRLEEFAAQAEAEGVGPVSREKFDAELGKIVKAPRPEDRTSRSPDRDDSPEK